MPTITGLTADRMQEIIDGTIVDADIVGGHLILTLHDGSTVDAGVAQGPPGTPGTNASNLGKGSAFPAGATDGDLFVRTDQVGDPLYKFTDGAWAISAGGLQKVTAFPGSPTDGDVVVRTDLNGSPMFAYSPENGWEQQPRMGAVTVPAVRAYLSANTATIASGTTTSLSWDSEDYDTDAIHDFVTNPSRFTCKTPGLYSIQGVILWMPSVTGQRQVSIAVNGTVIWDSEVMANTTTGEWTVNPFATTVKLAAGDYVEVKVWHSAGGPLAIQGTRSKSNIAMTWLGGSGQTVDERGVPACRATLASGTQAVAPGSAIVLLPNEDFDTDGMHDTSVNTSRLTIKTPGLYQIDGFAEFSQGSAAGTGYVANIFKNGTNAGVDPYMLGMASPVGSTSLSSRTRVSGALQLAAGDYLELQVINGDTVSRTLNRAYLSATLIGSGKTVTPFVRVFHSAAQSIPSASATVLAFNSEASDNDGVHDTVTNNSRLICRTAGVYMVHGSVEWAGGSTAGRRQLALLKNGATSSYTLQTVATTFATAQEVSELIELAVGDYVELQAFQDSGSAMNVTASGYSPFFEMVKIGAPMVGSSGVTPVEGWHLVGAAGEPAFQNSYANYGGANANASFFKDPHGVVHLRGMLATPASPQAVAFTLPAGYRPNVPEQVPHINATGAGRITIGTDGTVTVQSAPASQWLSLGSITFRADGA